ncbi:hypothetical protein [Salinimicrobium sp. GXAS 041]|uniref:hypothetical protein n=1 Tax=Salinimicrobium sp. GXAS 041 TaxID=3400806 RepID=UPI003C7489E4
MGGILEIDVRHVLDEIFQIIGRIVENRKGHIKYYNNLAPAPSVEGCTTQGSKRSEEMCRFL